MERNLSFDDVKKAVEEAYESVKSVKEGEIDPRNIHAKAGEFGITVTLADGRTFSKGDADVKSPMGGIAKVPEHLVLFVQDSPEEIVKKSGTCPCHKIEHKPKDLGLSAHGIRAFSAIEPTGDPEGKWGMYEEMTTGLMGNPPVLDDKLFEQLYKAAQDNNVVDKMAADGYYLYDDAELAVKLYVKAEAMTASPKDLAMMGATIAADGVNPASGAVVFDGALSQNIVGFIAAHGPHKMNAPWLVLTGLPAKRSWGGAIVGVMPGVMSIAAYAPELNPAGVSVKAARAIKEVMRRLDLSVFASAKVEITK